MGVASSKSDSRRYLVEHIAPRSIFTGLFLAPLVLMHALSTMAMAHHEYVNSFYASKSPVLVKERELDYSRSFPTNLTRDVIAQQILNDLGMDGTHSVSSGGTERPLVIQRQHAMLQRSLTFEASKSQIPIEPEDFCTPAILERLHRRRGYQQPYALDTWGFTVGVARSRSATWERERLRVISDQGGHPLGNVPHERSLPFR